jgi:hypothetical protein
LRSTRRRWSSTSVSTNAPATRGEVRLDGGHDAVCVSAQARRHLLDLVILGDDHDVVPVRDELLGQCESDPAGRPGHERESCAFSVRCISH